MKISISGGWVPAYRIGEFIKKIDEPKPFDLSADFGSTINFVLIDLESQNPEKPFHNRTQDRRQDGRLVFSIVLDEELKSDDQTVVNKQIAKTILNLLSKSFHRWKIPNFDSDSFLNELTHWFDRKLNESNRPQN